MIQVLRPFAPPALPGFFATTAYADSCPALTRQVSPGKVQNLSPRADRLYPMRLGMMLGFAVPSQLTARTWPRCRFVFLRSWVCYKLLSASPRGYALLFATVPSSGPDWLLSIN